MEIEAKFRIDDPAAFTALAGLERAGDYTLAVAPHVEQQRNIYYDTADGRLRAAHYGLRIRSVGDRTVATLKGPNQGQGELHRRPEWELEATSPDPATWPEGPARRELQALIGAVPLVPLLEIHTARRHILAAHDGRTVAEISLDEGVLIAAGRREPFHELEIELLPAGEHTDLEALIAALGRHTRLTPEHRSKLERGLALL